MNMKALLAVSMVSVAVLLPAVNARAQAGAPAANAASSATPARAALLAKVPRDFRLSIAGSTWQIAPHPAFGLLEAFIIPQKGGGSVIVGVDGLAVRTIIFFVTSAQGAPHPTGEMDFTPSGEPIVPPDDLAGMTPQQRSEHIAFAVEVRDDALLKVRLLEVALRIDTDAGLEARLREAKIIP